MRYTGTGATTNVNPKKMANEAGSSYRYCCCALTDVWVHKNITASTRDSPTSPAPATPSGSHSRQFARLFHTKSPALQSTSRGRVHATFESVEHENQKDTATAVGVMYHINALRQAEDSTEHHPEDGGGQAADKLALLANKHTRRQLTAFLPITMAT